MARSTHLAQQDISSLRLVLGNYYVNTATFTESGSGAAMTVKASIEYPAGTFTQVLFSTLTAGTIADGGLLVSDSVSVAIPKGAVFFVRQYLVSTKGIPYSSEETPAETDGLILASSDPGDLTLSGTVAFNSSRWITPAAIIAPTTKRSYAMIGDNRIRGKKSNTTVTGLYDPPIGIGDFEQNMRDAAHLSVAFNGTTAAQYLASNSIRSQLVAYCSDVLVGYGINDLARGTSATATRSDIEALIALYGKRTFVGIVGPRTTGTFTTLPGQTPFTQEAARQTLNGYIRSGLAGASGFVDITDGLESRTSPGKWRANLTEDGINATIAGYRESRLQNPMTGGGRMIYASTNPDKAGAVSAITGVKFLVQGGDGGSAIYTEDDNAAYYSQAPYWDIRDCAFLVVNADLAAPAKWGWGIAFELHQNNGSAFSGNDVFGAFDPTLPAAQQIESLGISLGTDGTNAAIAVLISHNRLWYLHTALVLGEEVLAFWFDKNECIKCYRGIYAPADYIGDGVVLQADTRITDNHIKACVNGIDVTQRQLMHIAANQVSPDSAFYDNGLGFTGIRLANCQKYRLDGNSITIAEDLAWPGTIRGLHLVSCLSGQINMQKVNSYFDDAITLQTCKALQFDNIQLTPAVNQIPQAGFVFSGACRNIQIGLVQYADPEPTDRYRFDDAGTTINDLTLTADEWNVPGEATTISPSPTGVLTVTRRAHAVNTSSPANVTSIVGPSVRNGVRLTLHATSSSNALTLVDGGNLLLAGNFVSTNARDMIELEYYKVFAAWLEISRSDNQ